MTLDKNGSLDDTQQNLNFKLVLTENSLKRHAKRLMQEMKSHVPDFKLSQSQEMLAKVLGMNNWHELHQTFSKSSQAPEKAKVKKIIPKRFIQNNEMMMDFILEILEEEPSFNLTSDEKIHLTNTEVEQMCHYGDIREFLTHLGYWNTLLSSSYVDFAINLKNRRCKINATIGTKKGQSKIYLQIDTINNKMNALSNLVFNESVLEHMNKYGKLCLVNGHTGSGKTLFLNTYLNDLGNKNPIKIISYEDVIECDYDDEVNIAQTELHRFGSASRAILNGLRRSPDKIIIGDIRDKETFETIVNAVPAGIGIYSSIYSSDVAGSILRIKSILNDSRLLKISLNSIGVIINQKLITSDMTGNKILLQEFLPFNENVVSNILETIDTSDFSQMCTKLLQKHGSSFEMSLNKLIRQGHLSKDYPKKISDIN